MHGCVSFQIKVQIFGLLYGRVYGPLKRQIYLKVRKTKEDRSAVFTSIDRLRDDQSCFFVKGRHPPIIVGGAWGGTPALRLAWHCQRHGASPVLELLCPKPIYIVCPSERPLL